MAERVLNKFERARIVGARALQLSMGAPCLLKKIETIDPIDLAEMELEKGVIPLQVV
jgi:DNA-directed RNA polymerase subunit K